MSQSAPLNDLQNTKRMTEDNGVLLFPTGAGAEVTQNF